MRKFGLDSAQLGRFDVTCEQLRRLQVGVCPGVLEPLTCSSQVSNDFLGLINPVE